MRVQPTQHQEETRSFPAYAEPLWLCSPDEIYRWVKIGLWIWFITTGLFGWISVPPCPWASQESLPWHPATPPPAPWSFMVLWRKANFTFCKALLQCEIGLLRDTERKSFWLMGCYCMFQHFLRFMKFWQRYYVLTFVPSQQTGRHIMLCAIDMTTGYCPDLFIEL